MYKYILNPSEIISQSNFVVMIKINTCKTQNTGSQKDDKVSTLSETFSLARHSLGYNDVSNFVDTLYKEVDENTNRLVQTDLLRVVRFYTFLPLGIAKTVKDTSVDVITYVPKSIYGFVFGKNPKLKKEENLKGEREEKLKG